MNSIDLINVFLKKVSLQLECTKCALPTEKCVLPCGHMFCRDCIEQAFKNKKHMKQIVCYSCNKLHEVTSEWIAPPAQEYNIICEEIYAFWDQIEEMNNTDQLLLADQENNELKKKLRASEAKLNTLQKEHKKLKSELVELKSTAIASEQRRNLSHQLINSNDQEEDSDSDSSENTKCLPLKRSLVEMEKKSQSSQNNKRLRVESSSNTGRDMIRTQPSYEVEAAGTKMPRGHWTTEKIIQEALKYDTMAQFKAHAGGAYYAAWNKAILDKVCAHMRPSKGLINEYDVSSIKVPVERLPRGFWTMENVRKEAMKYEYKVDFKTLAGGAYSKAKRTGNLDSICRHMKSKWMPPAESRKAPSSPPSPPPQSITSKGRATSSQDNVENPSVRKSRKHKHWKFATVREEALKYNTRIDFKEGSRDAYNCAYRGGYLYEVCAHMLDGGTDRRDKNRL